MALFGSSTPKESPMSEQIKLEIQKELAMANATELVNKITQNCFDKCIQQPSDSITRAEDTCVNDCVVKYMRSWNVISRTYISRIQREKTA